MLYQVEFEGALRRRRGADPPCGRTGAGASKASERGRPLTALLVEGALSPRNSGARQGDNEGEPMKATWYNKKEMLSHFGRCKDGEGNRFH